MTLLESLTEHYIPYPDRMISVKVNDCETTDWDTELKQGDVVAVDIPHIGIRDWVIE